MCTANVVAPKGFSCLLCSVQVDKRVFDVLLSGDFQQPFDENFFGFRDDIDRAMIVTGAI